ncbi:MAG: 30S ribosomal protein S17 [Patescibacteria group bacterium]|nr:30S ribosomal protein S17 [Patescibacteria group bacterium]
MTKIFEGKVVSLKMQNTAVVEVLRRVPHPMYKKVLKRTKKHKADTAGLALLVGDKVKIVEVRPISKEKHFKVLEKIK